MKNVKKEDLMFALRRLMNYLDEMSQEEVDEFANYRPICSAFMPTDFRLDCGIEPDVKRRIHYLELRYR